MNAELLSCRSLLNGLCTDNRNAEHVHAAHPNCQCEAHQVGATSPGRVEDPEVLYRFIISPGDIDTTTGKLLAATFQDAYRSGHSLIRDMSTDVDITNLIVDRLWRKDPAQPIKTVLAIIRMEAFRIRGLHAADIGRIFTLYDETVPRRNKDDERIPTHVSLMQRVPPPGTAGAKGIKKKHNYEIYKMYSTVRVEVDGFRNGLVERLNAMSRNGDFTSPAA